MSMKIFSAAFLCATGFSVLAGCASEDTTGGSEDAERLRAAMPGDERVGARLDDRLCRLDAGALCGVEILLVADDPAGAALQVVKQEIARPTEAGVEQRIEVVSGRGEDQFHGATLKVFDGLNIGIRQ